MKVCAGIVLIILAVTFYTKDALTSGDQTDPKARSDYFLLVDELTPPKEFIGVLAVQNIKDGGHSYELITEENGQEVRQALNNQNDPFFLKGDSIPYENIQNTFKALVGNKVKILGQLVSGMRAEHQVPDELQHTTFHWIRVISIERLK